MEKERGSKTLAVIALVVAALGLSIGFAAYTETLTISNTSATVGAGAEDDFKVEFSTSQTVADERTFQKLVDAAQTVDGATAVASTDPAASIAATTVSGLSANFTKPGQSVTYTLYVHNTGKFLAYLKSITIGEKTCTAKEGTTQSLVDKVCPSLSMEVEVQDETATNVSVPAITGHDLAIGGVETVKVTMTYDENAQFAADGDFTVNFGQINLDYNYVD